MNRRRFLAGAAAVGASPLAAAPRPLNVLFLLADQWRFSAFSHSSDPVVRTPNFDRLAEQGARFKRAYAANPVCTPNRSCILTGRYSHQHHMTQNDIMLPPTEVCIAEAFSSAGYATHYIGKWHMDGEDKPGYVPPGWRRRGFQTFEGFNRGHYYPTGAQYFSDDGKRIQPGVYEPTYQTDLAISFLRRNRARPFFCYLSWGPPHQPYNPPPEWKRYDPAKMEWRPNVPAAVRSNPRVCAWLAGYYGLCSSLDHELGRLMKVLEEEGLANNTLVVFSADHGDMLGSHGLYYKSKPEEESLHVPLLMRLPGRIRAGQTVETLASSIDLMPTIQSLCGLKTPAAVTGRDLSGCVLGAGGPKVDSIYAEGQMRMGSPPVAATGAARPGQSKKAGRPPTAAAAIAATEGVSRGMEWRALVTPAHKLVVGAGYQVTGLFDLEKDPYELNNLAEDRGAAALRRHLFEQMRRWARQTGDRFPEPTPPARTMYSDEEAARARA